jgi:uncharacterized repeat protein (TIGR02543 family)
MNPYKAGHLFDDWYIDEALTTPYDFSQPVTSDLSLYAGYYLDYANLTNHITQEVMPACVTVITTHKKGGFITSSTAVNTGSGVIIKKTNLGYYLLTNDHVTALKEGYNSASYEVEDYRGHSYTADLIAADETYDLALLYFTCEETYPVIPLAEKDAEIDTAVVAIGQPKEQDNALTYGSVAKLDPSNMTDSAVTFPVYYHTAPVNTGSSGGALLNTDCALIGINFAVATDSEGDFVYGLAIPLEEVQEFLAIHWK